MICLHCQENKTTGSNRICDTCYDNAGEFVERNINHIKAIPYLLDACGTTRHSMHSGSSGNTTAVHSHQTLN